MCIHIIFSKLLLLCICVQGNPVPEFWDIFKGSNWIDKLPSVEVKVGQAGVTVSTGPSREELYWTIGYVVAGVLAFVVCLIALGFCLRIIFKAGTRSNRQVIVREVPMIRVGASQADTRLMTPTFLSSNFRTNGLQHADSNTGCYSQHYISNNSSKPLRQNPRNTNRKECEDDELIQVADCPPPPYRSRN